MKATLLKFLFVGFSSISFASVNKNTTNIEIDLKDLRPYSDELQKLEPFETPYASIFQKEKVQLAFIAAEHVEGDQNTTCKTVRSLFKIEKPQFLLVEGFSFTKINDEEQIKYAQDCERNNYKGCGEDACAVNMALAENISFNYAEPGDLAIKEAIVKNAYNERELLFFYGLRYIPQLIRQGITNEKTIKRRLVVYLENTATKRLIVDSLMTIEEFEAIFLEKLSRRIEYLKVDTDLVSPRIDNNPEWSNRMSYQVGEVREHHIVKMIETRINKYSNVLIVYGQGHLVKERVALEKAFSNVRNIKLF